MKTSIRDAMRTAWDPSLVATTLALTALAACALVILPALDASASGPAELIGPVSSAPEAADSSGVREAYNTPRWLREREETGEEALRLDTEFLKGVTGSWNGLVLGGQLMMNIRADGTLDWYGSWFFGNGTGRFLDGPVYGSWWRTGDREITTIEIGYLFDGEGVFDSIGRVTQKITFSEDFSSFESQGFEELFLPEQNPADPAEEPYFAFEFAYGPAAPLRAVAPPAP
jgi:hypothetical protein